MSSSLSRAATSLLLLLFACGDDGGGGGGGGGGSGTDTCCQDSDTAACVAGVGGAGNFTEELIDNRFVHGQNMEIVDINKDGAIDEAEMKALAERFSRGGGPGGPRPGGDRPERPQRPQGSGGGDR